MMKFIFSCTAVLKRFQLYKKKGEQILSSPLPKYYYINMMKNYFLRNFSPSS